MSLDFFVREKKFAFSQEKMLEQIKKQDLEGICLTLSSAWVHFRRNKMAQDLIIATMSDLVMFKALSDIQRSYGEGNLSGGSKHEMQEPPTVRAVFGLTLNFLIDFAKLAKQDALTRPIGAYPVGVRPMIRHNLIPMIIQGAHPLYLVVFNLKDGRMGLEGAHAIVVDGMQNDWGIFDPNFGWMQLQRGVNGIDLGVVLNEFVSEYGITNATSYQDFTGFA